jgi:signal transduction histidine kinase
MSPSLSVESLESLSRLVRLGAQSLHPYSTAIYQRIQTSRPQRLFASANHPEESEADQRFCDALSADSLSVIDDARDDDRLADHPWVAGPTGLRFLASMPIDGLADASAYLVITDTEPRTLTRPQRRQLEDLAALAGDLLALARARETIAADRQAYQQRADELARPVAELTRSNRQLEQFAYVASHDLQEPLRMVTGFLGLLDAEYGDQLDEDAATYIGYAVDGARRMKSLINGLLTYSRVWSSEEPFVDVDADDAFVRAWNQCLEEYPDTTATISHHTALTIRGREQQIQRLFANLLSNALHYAGDDIHIEAVGRERDSDYLFYVRDDGVGVPEDQRERIFDIFVRASKQSPHEGTGIGLAICASIVEEHGGTIWVEPTPGGGATFFFTLAKEL